MQTIPLSGGAVNAHQVFSVQLGANFIEFKLDYITRSETDSNFAPWVLDLSIEGELLVAGLALLPGSNIIDAYNLGIGSLYFVGDQPTLENLGSSNQLVWENV